MREWRFPVQVRMLCSCCGVFVMGWGPASSVGCASWWVVHPDVHLQSGGAVGWCPWGPPCPLGCVVVTLLCMARLVQHTKDLMETEEKLCIKVLRTLQQMLVKRNKYGERVSIAALRHIPSSTAQLAASCPLQFCSNAGVGSLVTFICLGRATCCGKCS